MFQECKIVVDEYKINYVQVGDGEHSVLCMPGALGNIWDTFKLQIEGFDAEKFSLIVWDPPDQGESRPPKKESPTYYLEKNADYGYKFMKALNIQKFSLMGWCHGGVSCIILADKYPEAVRKLVVWGARSFILHHELEFYKTIKDVNNWSEYWRKPMVELYGREKFQNIWAEVIDTLELVYNCKGGNMCSDIVKNVTCPTLILSGGRDPVTDDIHACYLHNKIRGSRLYVYPEGRHDLHSQYGQEFNQRVQEFLLQD